VCLRDLSNEPAWSPPEPMPSLPEGRSPAICSESVRRGGFFAGGFASRVGKGRPDLGVHERSYGSSGFV
jgi:hypothetical protein